MVRYVHVILTFMRIAFMHSCMSNRASGSILLPVVLCVVSLDIQYKLKEEVAKSLNEFCS